MLCALPLIVHVSYNELVRGVLEPEKFGDSLISSNIRCREIDGLFDVPHGELIRITQIQKQEGRIGCEAEHISGVGDGTGLRHSRAYGLDRFRVLILFRSCTVAHRGLGGSQLRLASSLRDAVTCLDLTVSWPVAVQLVNGLLSEGLTEQTSQSTALNALKTLISALSYHLVTYQHNMVVINNAFILLEKSNTLSDGLN